uniref:Xylose isomerase-like TIM barrel domain-containing protein n=1 Tax=Leptobrachium leishanense TaxID=445787 RepID=A0A8C5WFC4_9ANUR
MWKAVLEAKRVGARAFGMFLRSQRSWNSKSLDDEAAEKFQSTCQECGFESCYILPHSPYLMNLGSPKEDVFLKSRAMLVEELGRCKQLGLTLYNIHPGSRVGAISVTECIKRIADGINYAHSQVPDVTVVLENMSCQGSTIGGHFEELREIIDHITDKSRIGVCLDTCHAFAAGHNLADEAGVKLMIDTFSKIVGISYLKAVHLNDSKVVCLPGDGVPCEQFFLYLPIVNAVLVRDSPMYRRDSEIPGQNTDPAFWGQHTAGYTVF